MPCAVAGASGRLLRSLSTTEALAGCSLLANSDVARHGDVHAGAGDFGERGDGPRELAFERAAVVDLLEELGGAEGRPVEDLEADAARRRQPLEANSSRSSSTREAGTRTARPPSSS